MIYCYLFEAKSIQSYLFQSGKLKDIIAASERLDQLIDTNQHSILSHVLNNAGLSSDLLDINLIDDEVDIHFLRCKGGAFYAYSSDESKLLSLRSLWTMTVNQLFPSLEYTDALVSSDNLADALDKGHQTLANDRNAPAIKHSLSPAICERYQRTGNASIALNSEQQKHYRYIEDETHSALDLDSLYHRQAYDNLNMKDKAALQDKFTPDELKQSIHYPINLDNEFEFSNSAGEKVKDIALIHIDGNGLGLLLMALKTALKEKTPAQTAQAFRLFSEALCNATQKAAQTATGLIAKYQYEQNGKAYLPMRPIVLGGDDVTLLCRADLALNYSKHFCAEFKAASKQQLSSLLRDYKLNISPYLTASGGILYHKASHPFTHSHHLVEGLCALAKALTKNKDKESVGSAAIAMYRLSNASYQDISDLIKQTQVFTLPINQTEEGVKQPQICLGINTFYIDDNKADPRHITQLEQALTATENSIHISRWRQIAGQLGQGDLAEAQHLMDLAAKNTTNKQAFEQLKQQVADILKTDTSSTTWWYSEKADDKGRIQYQTLINDLLVLSHFQHEVDATSTNKQEPK